LVERVKSYSIGYLALKSPLGRFCEKSNLERIFGDFVEMFEFLLTSRADGANLSENRMNG
jgi:hypothetical protein